MPAEPAGSTDQVLIEGTCTLPNPSRILLTIT
jgi:hypothetical protein